MSMGDTPRLRIKFSVPSDPRYLCVLQRAIHEAVATGVGGRINACWNQAVQPTAITCYAVSSTSSTKWIRPPSRQRFRCMWNWWIGRPTRTSGIVEREEPVNGKNVVEVVQSLDRNLQHVVSETSGEIEKFLAAWRGRSSGNSTSGGAPRK